MTSITVIVPAYNAAQTLERCAWSILMQEGVDFDFVIVDDGSEDETPFLADGIAARDSRVTVLHQRNKGRSCARNAGIYAARGTWVSFVDADDWLLPGALEAMAGAITDDVDVVWAGYAKVETTSSADSRGSRYYGNGTWASQASSQCFVDSRVIVNTLINPRGRDGVGYDAALTLDGTIERSACAKLYRRSVLLNYSDVKFPEGLRYGEDALFNALYLSRAKPKIAMTPRIAYCYEMGNSGTCMTFGQADVDALPLFCNETKRVFHAVEDSLDCDIREQQVIDFIGREINMVVMRAVRYGSSAKEVAAILQPTLTSDEIRRIWNAYQPDTMIEMGFRNLVSGFTEKGFCSLAIIACRMMLPFEVLLKRL